MVVRFVGIVRLMFVIKLDFNADLFYFFLDKLTKLCYNRGVELLFLCEHDASTRTRMFDNLNIVCFAFERFAGKNLELLYYKYISIVPGDFVLAAKSFFIFTVFSLTFASDYGIMLL